jgi:hypothetical protein
MNKYILPLIMSGVSLNIVAMDQQRINEAKSAQEKAERERIEQGVATARVMHNIAVGNAHINTHGASEYAKALARVDETQAAFANRDREIAQANRQLQTRIFGKPL